MKDPKDLLHIVREQVDGAAGLRTGATNLPRRGERWWAEYVARLRAVAARAGS